MEGFRWKFYRTDPGGSTKPYKYRRKNSQKTVRREWKNGINGVKKSHIKDIELCGRVEKCGLNYCVCASERNFTVRE